MDKSDPEYIQHCRNGQPDEFRHLVERYQGAVVAFLSGLLRDRGQVEEAAQETFVRAFFTLQKLRSPESFNAWLLGIAKNVVHEYERKARRHDREREASRAALESEPARSREHRLEEAIAALPESYRRIVLLRYYEDLSCREVADRLALPLGTVTKMLSRAYAQLRQILNSNQAPAAALCLEEQP